MTVKPKKRSVFAVEEYSEKIKARLENLEKSSRPGEVTGYASKSEMLSLFESQIKDLSKKGYTARQIADALSDDVFSILPKMVSEFVRTNSSKRKYQKRKLKSDEKSKLELSEKPNASAEKTLTGASKVDNKVPYQKQKSFFIEDID